MSRTIPVLFLLPYVSSVPAVAENIEVGGARRTVVRVPSNHNPEIPSPVLFLLHGFASNGNEEELFWRLAPLAEERGILYVHPDGTLDRQGRRFWNATEACCNAGSLAIDDSGYLHSLIEEIEESLNVDRDRVFLAGFSNGGFMSHRMACDHADTVAAIASLAGATFLDPGKCNPSETVHILQIHGSNDGCIFYEGSPVAHNCISGLPSSGYPGAVETVEQWATHNECAMAAGVLDGGLDIVSNLAGFETTSRRYVEDCESGGSAELWTMADATHAPNLTTNGLTTNLAIHVIDWLQAHPKRAPPVAAFTVTPESGMAPVEIHFDASATTVPDGSSVETYHWDFGDGTSDEGATASHTYSEPGRYSVSLRAVTNDQRVSNRTTKRVTGLCSSGDTSPWAQTDIGEPQFPGAARFETTESRQVLHLCSGGTALTRPPDQFFFVHQQVRGDFRITAGIRDFPEQDGTKVGVMARHSLDAGSPFVAAIGTDSRFRLRFRDREGTSSRARSGESFEAGGWVRLERRGNVFRGESSFDGENWTPISKEEEIDGTPETVFVGVAGVGGVEVAARFEPLEVVVTNLELSEDVHFLRADCNDDGTVDISDASCLLNWLFLGGDTPVCAAVTNTNGDKGPDISDATYLLNHLFLGGPAPVAPYPECGRRTLPVDANTCGTAPESCSR